MKMTEFTKRECDYFRRECNFTDEERAVFDLRTSARSITQICMEMHMSESTVHRRLNSIKSKIFRVMRVM